MTKLITILTTVLFSAPAFGASLLTGESFPKTIADTSFVDRMENATAGYEPYGDASAYDPLSLEAEAKEYERQMNRLQAIADRDAQTMSPTAYCNKYPTDSERCPQNSSTFQNTENIGNAPQPTTVAQTTNTTGAQQTTQPTTTAQTTTAEKPQPTVNLAQQKPTPTGAKYNNRLHGYKCTPPERSNYWSNKIYTSGKYESIDSAFEKGMITIFRKEGGCGKIPGDRGGYTCYGISSVANPGVNMKTLTRAKAQDIAYGRYYTDYHLEKLPDSVRGDVLQACWGSGVETGINLFRGMFKLRKNGRVDADLIAAAENYQGDLHNDFLDVLQNFYVTVSKRGQNRKFLKSWMEGVRLFRENGCFVEPKNPLHR